MTALHCARTATHDSHRSWLSRAPLLRRAPTQRERCALPPPCSCQCRLADSTNARLVRIFAPSEFGTVIPWLAMHRDGLVVFVHPISDNELIDHRDLAIWMGAVCELKLDVLLAGPTEDLL